MHDLASYFGDDNVDTIERLLCEDDVVLICCDYQDEPESVIEEFAFEFRDLSFRTTEDRDLEITFKDRTHKVGLQQSPTDGDRTRWAIRDILQPDFQMRVLRSCLGTDTLAFVVDTPEEWKLAEEKAPDQVSKLFLPFTDDVGFYVAES